ncbi:MAG: hypothetical protein ABFS10_00600 [Bacteroidota bacterium]
MATMKRVFGLIGVCLLMTWIFASCTNYTIPGRESGKIKANSCEGCHTDYEKLVAVHSPDTAAPVGGCGGDAPHFEPYDRVFMGGDGYDAYKTSGHYAVGCTGCHNGNGDTGEKDEAHSGDFIKHPSLFYADKCGTCHQGITDNFSTSLHHGTGQKRKVTIRSGLSGPQDFDQLPAHQIEGYNNNCAHCHGTCGNCHVVRPAVGGGGLSKGHNFNKTPHMLNVCVTCHVSRGGHAFLGVAPGTKPDLHQKMGFDCLSCHDGHELHGDGQPVDQRYAYSELPECEDCHSDLETSNSYHSKHFDDFNCQVCHSQEYNNCGSCHIHGEGARVSAYMDFKIAVNPLPDLKPGYDFAVVRRTLAAPDNWEKYGVDEYANFEAFPTYNYNTPHNLQLWTERTIIKDGVTGCGSSCHIRNEGDSLINKELYLFKSDLLEWELEATGPITVDDKLPPGWFN